MKLDFTQFKLYRGVAHRNYLTKDVREAFADMVYNNGAGAAAMSLATRIYESKGPTEYSDRDVELMRQVTGAAATASFVDSLETALREAKNMEHNERGKEA